MGKKHPYYGKSTSITFSVFPHTVGFVAFSRSLGSRWGNPCISQMMKCTIGWESNGKNHPYFRKSMTTNYAGSLHTMGFVEYYREPIS